MFKPLWTEVYRPANVGQLVGHEAAVTEITAYLREWKTGGPAVYIYGSPGVGKTSLVGAVCASEGWELLSVNASDQRSAQQINALRQVGPVSVVESMRPVGSRRKTVVLFDEVDGIHSGDAMDAVQAWVDDPRRATPLFLTCNQVSTSLRTHCLSFLLLPPPDHEILAFLLYVVEKERGEGQTLPPDLLERTGRDIRQCLVSLQFGVFSDRRTETGLKALLAMPRCRHPDIASDWMATQWTTIPPAWTFLQGAPKKLSDQADLLYVEPGKHGKWNQMSQWGLRVKAVEARRNPQSHDASP